MLKLRTLPFSLCTSISGTQTCASSSNEDSRRLARMPTDPCVSTGSKQEARQVHHVPPMEIHPQRCSTHCSTELSLFQQLQTLADILIPVHRTVFQRDLDIGYVQKSRLG